MREANYLVFELNDQKNPLTSYPKYDIDTFEELFEVYGEISIQALGVLMHSDHLNKFENVSNMSVDNHNADLKSNYLLLVQILFDIYCK